MKQRKVGMQKIVSVLLLVALLLTFATPAFADGGPFPDNNTADVIDGEAMWSMPSSCNF